MINLGIIGIGYWGPNLIRNFLELPNSNVVYICDIDAKKCEELSKTKKYQNIKITQNLENVINDKFVDAVVISTPTKTHYSIAKKCLENKKHTLIEKPMTYDPMESLELIKKAEEEKLVLMAGHTFLYNSAILKIKKEIEAGNLGETLYLYAIRTGLGPIRQDVNVVYDLAAHDISIFNHLVDILPEEVICHGRVCVQKDKKLEDIAFLTLNYPNNIIATTTVSWIDPIKTRKMIVVGSKKMIVFDDLNPNEKLKIYDKGTDYQPKKGDFGEFQLSFRDGDMISPKIDFNEPLFQECEHFIKCIENNQVPFTDGKKGYETVCVLHASNTSLNTGKKTKIKY